MNLMQDKATFQEWKDSPATQDFLTYLAERQMALMQAWGKGLSVSPEEQAAAVLLGRLSTVRFEDMCEHYGLEMSDATQEIER